MRGLVVSVLCSPGILCFEEFPALLSPTELEILECAQTALPEAPQISIQKCPAVLGVL